jgi:hypothetical protein
MKSIPSNENNSDCDSDAGSGCCSSRSNFSVAVERSFTAFREMCLNKTQLRKQKIKVGMRKIISISFFFFRKYGLLKFEECLIMSSFENAQSIIDFT